MSEPQRQIQVKQDALIKRVGKAKEPSAPEQASEQSPVPFVSRRALNDPRTLSPANLIALQRTVGNRAVGRLIQRKLTVGAAHDAYEQEADRVADQVLSAPAALTESRPAVQRASEDEEQVQTKRIDPMESLASSHRDRQSGVTGNHDENSPFEAGGDFQQRLDTTRGGGSPLPGETREFMESHFGADFGGVRVHTGGESAQLNREVSAQAFTHGQDIYLGDGKTDLQSSAGQHLLAHELTHVVQQTGRAQRAFLQRRVMTRQDFTNKGALTAGTKLGGSSFSKLLTTLDKYHQAIANQDTAGRQKWATDLVTLCNAWLVSYNKRKKKKTQDAAKKINVDEARRQALLEPPEHHVDTLAGDLPAEMQKAFKYYRDYTEHNEHVKYARLLSAKQAFSDFVTSNSPVTPGYGTVADFAMLFDKELKQTIPPKSVNDASGDPVLGVTKRKPVGKIPAEVNCSLAACAAAIRHTTGKEVTTGDLAVKLLQKKDPNIVPTTEQIKKFQHPDMWDPKKGTGYSSGLGEASEVNKLAAEGIIEIVQEYGGKPAGGMSKKMKTTEAKNEMTQLLAKGNFVFVVLANYGGHWLFAHRGSHGEVEFIDYQSDHVQYVGPMLGSNPIAGTAKKELGGPNDDTQYIPFNA
ncbi:MAG: DUF4157 domain-containing protein [Anaerolineae bacterium]